MRMPRAPLPDPLRPPLIRRDRRARSRGQAVVEFALLAPVLLLLLAVGVDAGRMFFTWIEVVNAAREGAAYAAGNPTDTAGITLRVTQEASVQAQGGEGAVAVTAVCQNAAGTTITCATAAGGNGTGNRVTVTVARGFGFMTPLVGNVLGNSFSLRASATAAVFGLLPNGGDTPPGDCNDPRNATFEVTVIDMTVHLDASASTPNSGRCAIASFEWDMGDGTDPWPPLVGKQLTYTFTTPATYTITLGVSNPGGTETTTRTVTVPPAVAATPTPAPTATPAPTTAPTAPPDPACTMVALFTYEEQGNSNKYNFYGAYTGQPAPEIWFWTFGDGDVGWGQAPNRHTYGGSGPYTVTLTIINGSCSASTSQTLVP